MNTLKCEMCGSTDLIKNGNLYICQYCGTKYSVESQGKIKIDISEKIANLKMLARRARKSGDHESAAKYYGMLLLENPSDKESVTFNDLYNAMFSHGERLITTVQILSKQLTQETYASNDRYLILETSDVLYQWIDKLSDTIVKEMVAAGVEHGNALIRQIETTLSNGTGLQQFDAETDVKNAEALANDNEELTKKEAEALRELIESSGDVLQNNTHGDFDKALTNLMMALDSVYYIFIRIGDGSEPSKQEVSELLAAIHTENPTFVGKSLPQIEKFERARRERELQQNQALQSNGNTSRSGGCYIATSVYGSYDCPPVWTLRRFRDYKLAETRCGRIFVKTYYALSPYLVKWFGGTRWFQYLWKTSLDKLVSHLQKKGYMQTPYKDKMWL